MILHLAPVCAKYWIVYLKKSGFDLLPKESVHCSLQWICIFCKRHSRKCFSSLKLRREIGRKCKWPVDYAIPQCNWKNEKRNIAITRNNGLVTQDNPQTSTSIIFMLGYFVREEKAPVEAWGLWINRQLFFQKDTLQSLSNVIFQFFMLCEQQCIHTKLWERHINARTLKSVLQNH